MAAWLASGLTVATTPCVPVAMRDAVSMRFGSLIAVESWPSVGQAIMLVAADIASEVRESSRRKTRRLVGGMCLIEYP